jgi:hypothetical protein
LAHRRPMMLARRAKYRSRSDSPSESPTVRVSPGRSLLLQVRSCSTPAAFLGRRSSAVPRQASYVAKAKPRTTSQPIHWYPLQQNRVGSNARNSILPTQSWKSIPDLAMGQKAHTPIRTCERAAEISLVRYCRSSLECDESIRLAASVAVLASAVGIPSVSRTHSIMCRAPHRRFRLALSRHARVRPDQGCRKSHSRRQPDRLVSDDDLERVTTGS